MTAVVGLEADVQQRVLEGSEVLGAVRSVLKGRTMSWGVKKALYQQVIVLTVTYGTKTWGLREAEMRRLNVFEIMCLRHMVRVTRWDRVKNDELRMSAGIEESLEEKVDRRVF